MTNVITYRGCYECGLALDASDPEHEAARAECEAVIRYARERAAEISV